MLKITTRPTVEPITLTEAKAHLRVDFDYTEDDALITALISVVRDYAEGYQRRTLAVTGYELIADSFPKPRHKFAAYSPIRLEKPPHISVESITYTLADGSAQTLPPAAYLVKESGEIVPNVGYDWPYLPLAAGDAVRVRYTAGYNPDELPGTTKHGMLLLIGHLYENREAVVLDKTAIVAPFGVKALLDLDRRP